jgi:hypothetical protein
VERGEGFIYEQARNLMQAYSLYRENMISAKRHPDEVLIVLDRDKPRAIRKTL